MRSAHGIELSPGLLQPFDLKALRDDLHVMAFVRGHPEWEAVEAMVRYRDGGDPLIRAILTRHDQSQVDHVSGPMPSAPETAGRQCVQCAIAFEESGTAEGPWARVAFKSVAGEAVVLRVHAAGQPSDERGGFSDPGDHARHGSLPLMWRGRSALAAERTEVTFDGTRHDLPILVDRRPYFVGMHGFFTRQHWMGIVRAGVAEHAETAARSWIETGRSAETVTLTMAGDETQTVRGVLAGNRFELCELQVTAAGHDAGMSLSFAGERFTCAIDGTLAVVEGRVECQATEDTTVIRLVPETPAWAIRRAVRIVARRKTQGWSILTSVG